MSKMGWCDVSSSGTQFEFELRKRKIVAFLLSIPRSSVTSERARGKMNSKAKELTSKGGGSECKWKEKM